MTTIMASKSVMVGDRKTSRNEDVQKIFKVRNTGEGPYLLIGFSGHIVEGQTFIRCMRDDEPLPELENTTVMISDGIAIRIYECKAQTFYEPCNDVIAIGSGASIALGAYYAIQRVTKAKNFNVEYALNMAIQTAGDLDDGTGRIRDIISLTEKEIIHNQKRHTQHYFSYYTASRSLYAVEGVDY